MSLPKVGLEVWIRAAYERQKIKITGLLCEAI